MLPILREKLNGQEAIKSHPLIMIMGTAKKGQAKVISAVGVAMGFKKSRKSLLSQEIFRIKSATSLIKDPPKEPWVQLVP